MIFQNVILDYHKNISLSIDDVIIRRRMKILKRIIVISTIVLLVFVVHYLVFKSSGLQAIGGSI